MNSIKHSLAVLGMIVAPAFAAGQVSVSIDAGKPGPVINKYVYGQFAEQLGTGIYEGMWVGAKSTIPNTNGWRNDVVGALKALHVPLVRWPGGCFADTYHWRDGIGPQDKRPSNIHGDRVDQFNAVGTHEFFDLIDMLGADAYINGNVGTQHVDQVEEFVGADGIDRVHTAAVDIAGALILRADAVAPMVGVGEAAARPAHQWHMQLLERANDVIAPALGVGDGRLLADVHALVDAGAEIFGELPVHVFVDDRAGFGGVDADADLAGGERRRYDHAEDGEAVFDDAHAGVSRQLVFKGCHYAAMRLHLVIHSSFVRHSLGWIAASVSAGGRPISLRGR